MKKIRFTLALVIALVSWGCDRPTRPLTYKELPIAKYYDSDHSGSRFRVNLHIVSSNQYIIDCIGGSTFLTNSTGVSDIVNRRYAASGYGFPFIIWASKEAIFEDVWRAMELGVTNRFCRLAIQDGDRPKRKLRTLFRSDRSLGFYEHYIYCSDPRFLESPSNLVVIACSKQRLTFNDTPCLFDDLGHKLRRAKNAATGSLQLKILVTGDCSYQYVIDVISECKLRNYFDACYLGLQPAEKTTLITDCAK
jgi:hypothetical protein